MNGHIQSYESIAEGVVMTGLNRISQVTLCIALIAQFAGGLDASENEAMTPASQLTSPLETVPSDYFSFSAERSLPTEEDFGALRALSNANLRNALQNAEGPRLEYFFSEAIRRGGKEWSRFVADRWEAERKLLLKTARDFANDHDLRRETIMHPRVEWLTAMRRLEGKPDPLQILVAGRRKRSCFLGRLPDLFVLLANLDVDRAEIQFTEGGDYRSGRQARWRLEVADSAGHLLPCRLLSGVIIGGGMYQESTLQYGESWATELHLNSFVRIEAPGTYKIRVLYHDHIAIADCDKVTGLIMTTSQPIELRVEPVTVEATRDELDAVRKSISQLPTKGPIKFLDGDYHEGVYDFIERDSPPGKILTMGWKAVPAMIDATMDEKIKPVQRAWLLALLATITRINDPREEMGVLGNYNSRVSGWGIWGGTPGEWSGGIGTGTASISSTQDSIEPKRQLDFAKRWAVWRQKNYIKLSVVEMKEHK
jgi:hypothetical protein